MNTPLLSGNELKYVTEAVSTGWISSEGPFVSQLEDNFSRYVGRKFGIAVANGSAALDIAVQAAGIGEDDEVIIPTFTIISPALSVVRAGGTPVLVDSTKDDWVMNLSEIESRITSKTKAIIVVHVYGLTMNMKELLALAERHKLIVIEDAAEMIGQTCDGEFCGSFGLLSTFSFYANKHITTGEGGMVLTNDEELAERCKKLRNLAFEKNGPRFVHHEMGWNYRLTNVQAAIGVAQLEQIDSHIERKKQLGEIYQEELAHLKARGYTLPLRRNEHADNIYWVFGILAPDEAEQKNITRYLSDRNIGWRPFFWCMHEQPVFLNKGLFLNDHFPVAESLARTGFYIPAGLGLTTQDQLKVCQTIRDYFK